MSLKIIASNCYGIGLVYFSSLTSGKLVISPTKDPTVLGKTSDGHSPGVQDMSRIHGGVSHSKSHVNCFHCCNVWLAGRL